MSEIIKKIEKQIDIDKEVIDIAPRKGIKNIRNLIGILEEQKEQYEELIYEIKKEIIKRHKELDDVQVNPEIEKIEEEIKEINRIINICEDKPSYLKMGLDKISYNINGFYKKQLVTINNDIKHCLKRFEEVGIKLTKDDFKISEYANRYMTVLIEELEKGDINSQKVQDIFEKIYWECSDIILHINVNIKLIYESKVNEINKYYKNKSEELLNKYNTTLEGIEERKKELIKKKTKLENIDQRIIIDKFFDGTFTPVDFQKSEYTSSYENLISDKLENLDKDEKEKMDENIKKLYSNVEEYNNYLKFKFIIDEILKIRAKRLKEIEKEKALKKDGKGKNTKETTKKRKVQTKDKEKATVNTISQEIKKVSKQVIKLNSNIEFMKKIKITSKKKIEEKIIERNRKIIRLKDLYIRLDDENLKEKSVTQIDETSKILDIFKVAAAHYEFMAMSIIRKIPHIKEKDIHKMIKELKNFIRLTDINVINNVDVESDKEISIIIKDRYKLSGMTLSKENFEEKNIEDLTAEIKKINDYNNIEKSGITIDNIQFLLDSKQMIN